MKRVNLPSWLVFGPSPAMVEGERRLAELRALTGMSQAEALHWLTIISALYVTRRDSPAEGWQRFRWALMAGQSPVEAMANIAKRLSACG